MRPIACELRLGFRPGGAEAVGLGAASDDLAAIR